MNDTPTIEDKLEDALIFLEKAAQKGDKLKTVIAKPANWLFNGKGELFGNAVMRFYSSSLFISLGNPLLSIIPASEGFLEFLLNGAEAETGDIDTSAEKMDLALNAMQTVAGLGFIYYGLTNGNEARILTNIIRGISGEIPIEITNESGIPYLFYGTTLLKTAAGGTLGRYWNEKAIPAIKERLNEFYEKTGSWLGTFARAIQNSFESQAVKYVSKTLKDVAGLATVTALLYANYTLRGGSSLPVILSAGMTIAEPAFDISAAVYKKERFVQVANMTYNNMQYFLGFGLISTGIFMETTNLVNHVINFIRLLQNNPTYAVNEYTFFSGTTILLGSMLLYAADTISRKNIDHSAHVSERTIIEPIEENKLEKYIQKLTPYLMSETEEVDRELMREGLDLLYHNHGYQRTILNKIAENKDIATEFLDALVEEINSDYVPNDIKDYSILPMAYIIIRRLAKTADINRLPENESFVKEWALIYPNFEEIMK